MTLYVSADVVANRLRLPLPLSATVQTRIEDAIYDSQAKVETFLNRPLGGTSRTLTGLVPLPPYDLDDRRAWPTAMTIFDDRHRVTSWVASPSDSGAYDVTFMVGLDVAGDAELDPILRWIARDAAEDLRGDPAFTEAVRAVSSVSAEGQSVSYEKSAQTEGAVGAPPPLSTLKRWRRMSIRSKAAHPLTPWPYADRMV